MSVKGKRQIFPYLSAEAFKALRAYRGGSGHTDSAIIEAALREYFADAKDVALLMRRLDRHDRNMARLGREVALLSELASAWIRVWYAHTPALPVAEKEVAQRTAVQRYEQLLDHVVRRLRAGKRLATGIIVEDISDQGELIASNATSARGDGDKS